VGLSIDGPEELHDKHRRDKGGKPTFKKVFNAAKLLQKHEVPFNALVTLNYDNEEINLDSNIDIYAYDRFLNCVEINI